MQRRRGPCTCASKPTKLLKRLPVLIAKSILKTITSGRPSMSTTLFRSHRLPCPRRPTKPRHSNLRCPERVVQMARHLSRSFSQALLLSIVCLLVNCVAVAQPAENIRLTDITREAGISFVHNNGAFGAKYLPESLGPGCAFIDYDNDGRPDILLVNGRDWPGHGNSNTTLKLYHNNGNGTFTDVTA